MRRAGSPVRAWWYREPQNIPMPAIRRVPACIEGRQRRRTKNTFSVKPQVRDDSVLRDGEPARPNILVINAKSNVLLHLSCKPPFNSMKEVINLILSLLAFCISNHFFFKIAISPSLLTSQLVFALSHKEQKVLRRVFCVVFFVCFLQSIN